MQLGDPRIDGSRGRAACSMPSLDLGLTLIDTARSYGLSEERIGRHLARPARRLRALDQGRLRHRRPTPTGRTNASWRGVDAARDRLRTDVIDIVHLHSCGLETSAGGRGRRDALDRCGEQGKLRVAAYSGDDAALAFAVGERRLRQLPGVGQPLRPAGPARRSQIARARGARDDCQALAGRRPWHRGRPRRTTRCTREYHRRFAALRARARAASRPTGMRLALRFAAYADGVDCVIVGGTNVRHLERNSRSRWPAGPLEAGGLTPRIRDAFARQGADWRGLI